MPMTTLYYIDRKTGRKEIEIFPGKCALEFLYGRSVCSSLIGTPLRHLVKLPFISALYGLWQRCRFTKRNIAPFIKLYGIDPSEFVKTVDEFVSFNDFFCRTLRKDVRPLCHDPHIIILPADARYIVYPTIKKDNTVMVKGEQLSLCSLLGDSDLARRYHEGSLVIARLSPVDYHRFHFPCDGIPGNTRTIPGWLHSVHPIALKRNLRILTSNKRTITPIETIEFGTILFLAVGATNVGSIIHSAKPNTHLSKGDEFGMFTFGGSTIILLFEPDRIVFDTDLRKASTQEIEVRGLMGQSLGRKTT